MEINIIKLIVLAYLEFHNLTFKYYYPLIKLKLIYFLKKYQK